MLEGVRILASSWPAMFTPGDGERNPRSDAALRHLADESRVSVKTTASFRRKITNRTFRKKKKKEMKKLNENDKLQTTL